MFRKESLGSATVGIPTSATSKSKCGPKCVKAEFASENIKWKVIFMYIAEHFTSYLIFLDWNTALTQCGELSYIQGKECQKTQM